MRIYMDTEFIENGCTIDLLSLGLVAEDGRTLYLESALAYRSRANAWVQEHVLPHLHPQDCPARHADCPITYPAEMRTRLLAFAGQDPPEFWGYFCAYDWVALCQLFGTMMDIPPGWPYYCRDLRQWLDDKGLGHIRQPDDSPHHALSDAQWIAQTHKRLR